jgi:hypothetical protein
MLSFDFEEPTFHTCECCGGRTTHLTRFVYQDGDAYAVYYARFSDHPGERYVQAVVSIGDWSEDSGPWDRVAFALNIWVANDQFQVGVRPAGEGPWAGIEIIGRVLDRDEALRHERVGEVFHISDHMVAEDRPLRVYLQGAL